MVHGPFDVVACCHTMLPTDPLKLITADPPPAHSTVEFCPPISVVPPTGCGFTVTNADPLKVPVHPL